MAVLRLMCWGTVSFLKMLAPTMRSLKIAGKVGAGCSLEIMRSLPPSKNVVLEQGMWNLGSDLSMVFGIYDR